MIDRICHDARVAVRALLRARGVTSVAILSLALGIAANATVFSLVQAVEFPRLTYPESSRIVFLESNNHVRGLTGMPVSAPDALDIAAAARTLVHPSLTADQTSVLYEGTPPARVTGRRVEASFFDVMGVAPNLGRALRADDGPGSVVLADGLWRSAFGAETTIVGRAIRLDGGSVTVVGVMPPRFDADADFWVPLAPVPSSFARDDRQFTLFARLAPDVPAGDARAEIEGISRRLATDHPATNRDWTTIPIPLTRLHGRESRGAFVLLQGAVAFVLLIACANIANILLARATRRRHEMAVRVSLGASRVRLLHSLLVESLLLAFAGGTLGVLLAIWGIRAARAFGGFPPVIEPELNVLVLAFTALLVILTGVICGIVPAMRASGAPPSAALRADDARVGGAARGWLRSSLVVVQIASALVLAAGAALMVRTLVNRQQVDLGFEPRGALRAELALPYNRYGDPGSARSVVADILERLNRAPDVRAAGAYTWALPTGAGGQRQLTLPGEGDRSLPEGVRRGIEAVTPRFFEALGVPVAAGRALTDADRAGSLPVAVVNEELARHLWPDRRPVGEWLRLGSADEAAPIVTVVGVVGTIRRSAMHDVAVARVYVPFAQHPNTTISFIVRARGTLAAAERELHAAVAASDPSLFVEGLRTVEADLAQFVAPIRLIGGLLAGFGLAGLFLAGLGVFGTMSYTVSQREREMAVRAALGADRRDIFRLVFGGAVRIIAAGIAIGTVAALATTRTLASLLYGVSPTDPVIFTAVIAFLVIVALAACYRPARLAASADPMTILRQ